MAKTLIARMCRENTGSHFLDSGGAYGYTYNTPLPTKPLRLLASRWTAHDGEHYEEYTFRISTPQFLAAQLKLHRYLDSLFRAYCAAHPEEYYLQCAKDWIESRADLHTADVRHTTFNTYNYDNHLDQDFQGTLFIRKLRGDLWGTHFIILSTHNGCDIRGGYSRPRVFEIGSYEDLHNFLEWEVRLYCPGCCDDVQEEDCTFTGGGIPEDPTVEFHDLAVDMDTAKITCQVCGGEIRPYNDGLANCR